MQELPSYDEALRTVLDAVVCTSKTEYVPISSSLARILASDVLADRDFPPFNRSQMDGYAVRSDEIHRGVELQVVGQIPAGSTFEQHSPPNTCVAIATGAPVPEWCDAVIPHEQTNNSLDTVVFHCDKPSLNARMHMRGVDALKGDVLVNRFTQLAPHHIGMCASVGLADVPVVTTPKVIVITSGDEVVPISETPKANQIRNSNNVMVSQAFKAMGCEIIATLHVEDCLEATRACMAESLHSNADIVVTVGGISAGKRDYFPEVFADAGVETVLKGANIQPGKPIMVGTYAKTTVLGMPGNPVSALACACLFGWPVVRQMQGMPAQLPWQVAPLACDVKPNATRQAFRPCVLENGRVSIPTWQGSGDLMHTVETNGLVQLPQSDADVLAGTQVSCVAYPWNE
jgi:molybdopterin molybdotransferase